MVLLCIGNHCVETFLNSLTWDEARLGRYLGRDKLKFEFEQKFVKGCGAFRSVF